MDVSESLGRCVAVGDRDTPPCSFAAVTLLLEGEAVRVQDVGLLAEDLAEAPLAVWNSLV